MKHYILLYTFLFINILGHSQKSKNELIIGKWYNFDKTAIIEITGFNNKFIGHIVWMKEPNDKNGNPKLDIKNPDKNLRNQPILGSQNLFGLTYENGVWNNGEMYAYKRGGRINFDVVAINENELVIEIYKGFFTKKITFTKAN